MPLHQDITMVADTGPRPGISLWAPLVDVNENNGCLQIVPGSHPLNRKPRGPRTPFAAAHLEAEIRARYLRFLRLKAGQGVVIAHALFHASGPNRSAEIRPVVTSVLIPEEKRMIYYQREETEAGASLEAFEVDDAFLRRHRLGLRPDGGRRLGTVAEEFDDIQASTLTRLATQ